MLNQPLMFLLNDRSQPEADRHQAPSKPMQVGRGTEVCRALDERRLWSGCVLGPDGLFALIGAFHSRQTIGRRLQRTTDNEDRENVEFNPTLGCSAGVITQPKVSSDYGGFFKTVSAKIEVSTNRPN